MERQTLAGRYELQERVGAGWRARDLELQRDVLVRPADETTAAAALLDHPNVARVFDQGEADGERYVVLEYLAGGSLDERLPELDERGAHLVATGIAAALEHAHARGVPHGALSERSVFLDGEGRAKVAGFTAAGDPADDVAAFGGILDRLAAAAPALATVAAAAASGADAATLANQLRSAGPAPEVEIEEPTLIQQPAVPPPAPMRTRRLLPLLVALALLLVAAGVAAAVLVTSDDSPSADTTSSISVPVPSATSTEETEPTTAPPITTTSESTESTTEPEATEPQTTEATIETTTATEPVVPPPATTTEELPPTTTEEPPPTTTEEPPATTEVPPTTAP
jgi:serine/threonine protein kinase